MSFCCCLSGIYNCNIILSILGSLAKKINRERSWKIHIRERMEKHEKNFPKSVK